MKSNGIRQRTSRDLLMKGRRCGKCGTLLNRQKKRCKTCGKETPLPRTKK